MHYTASDGFLHASNYAVKLYIYNPKQLHRVYRKLIFGLSFKQVISMIHYRLQKTFSLALKNLFSFTCTCSTSVCTLLFHRNNLKKNFTQPLCCMVGYTHICESLNPLVWQQNLQLAISMQGWVHTCRLKVEPACPTAKSSLKNYIAWLHTCM